MQHQLWNRKMWLATFLVAINIFVLLFMRLSGCSVEKGKEVAVTPPPPATDGTDPAPGGDKPECSKVTTFDELAPVIALNCVGCHQGFDTLAVAKGKLPEMERRIGIVAGQPGHMPAGRPSLAAKDIALFQSWGKDGLLPPGACEDKTPAGPSEPDFFSFAWAEEKMFADASNVPVVDQPNVRYLIGVNYLNLGQKDEVATARTAANKATNSVSLERDVYPVQTVAPGIWRIDIDELGIEAKDWALIENASLLQFESFTGTGVALKGLTKSRLPWMNVADFNDTVLRNAKVYYALTKAPATLQQLVKNLDVDFAGDLLNFKALLVGFNGSALSPAANRLMSRHDSKDGFFWATYDTGPIVSNQQNLFKNPLLVEAGGQANLKFAAGEQLYSLPNGLIGSFLADAKGLRLDFANEQVVHDFTSNPISPTIRNSISCFRCHSGGILRATDQVRAAISGANIGAADTQRVLALFKAQPVIDSLVAEDNRKIGEAFTALGIDPTAPDPISKISDGFLGDLNLADVAALLFLRPEELKTCISLSDKGRQQASQLTTGGTISHDQFVQVVKDLLRDCRIFQDPLN